MRVTVFTTKSCPQCLVSKKHLEKRGVRFEEIRIDLNPEWIDRLKAAGFHSAPVVVVGEEDAWSGYSGDSIDEWAKEFAAAA